MQDVTAGRVFTASVYRLMRNVIAAYCGYVKLSDKSAGLLIPVDIRQEMQAQIRDQNHSVSSHAFPFIQVLNATKTYFKSISDFDIEDNVFFVSSFVF